MNSESDFRNKFNNIDLESDKLSQLFNFNSMVEKSPNLIRNNQSESDEDEDEEKMEYLKRNFENKLSKAKQKGHDKLQEVDKKYGRYSMFGGAKVQETQINKMYGGAGGLSVKSGISKLSHTNFKTDSIINYARPTNTEWELGEMMASSKNGQLIALANTLYERGCYVCNGFGHNSNKCHTHTIIKNMMRSSPFVKQIGTKTGIWLKQNQKFIQKKEWVFQQIALALCQAMYTNHEEYRRIAYAIGEEFVMLGAKRCVSCEGYGHMAVEKDEVRIKKASQLIGKLQGDSIENVSIICGTKLLIERQLQGWYHGKNVYSKLIQARKNDLKEKQENQEQATLQDLVAYFNKTDVTNMQESVSKIKSMRKIVKKAMKEAKIFTAQLSKDVKYTKENLEEEQKYNLGDINKQVEEEVEAQQDNQPNIADPNEKEEKVQFQAEKQEFQQQEEEIDKNDKFQDPIRKQLAGSGIVLETNLVAKTTFKIGDIPLFYKSKAKSNIRLQSTIAKLKKVFALIFTDFEGIKKDSDWGNEEETMGVKNLLYLMGNSTDLVEYSWLFYNDDALAMWQNIATSLYNEGVYKQAISEAKVHAYYEQNKDKMTKPVVKTLRKNYLFNQVILSKFNLSRDWGTKTLPIIFTTFSSENAMVGQIAQNNSMEVDSDKEGKQGE